MTVPKLRFPEFRDGEAWEEKILSNLSSCGLSNSVFNDPKKVRTGYKLINVSGMSNIYLGHSRDITFNGHLIRFRPNKKLP